MKKQFTKDEAMARLERAVEQVGSQTKFAEMHGLTTGYLHDVLRGNRALTDRVLATINLRRETIYVPDNNGN